MARRIQVAPQRVLAKKAVTLRRATVNGATGEVDVEPLRVKIAVVAEALGSNARTAEFLGVARSQPGKWLTGEERPNPRARRLIQDLDYVWDRITDDRSPAAAQIWLHSANAFLRGATPLTWLKTRGPDDVIAAIDAEEAGSYA
jgi:hypothetical protein